MRRKRVLLVGPVPPPIGGDTVSTLNLLQSPYWDEAGIDPVLVNTSAGDRVRLPDERLGAGDACRAAGILLRVVCRVRQVDAVLLWANSRFLCTAGVAIIAAARLARRPVVVKVFGGMLVERIRVLAAPWRRLVTYQLRRADCVFPQTERMVDELVGEFGLRPECVVCLPNYVTGDVSGGFAGQGAAEQRAGRRFAGRCVFVGQVKREKGIFDIIDALAGRSDITCDCYGPVLERDRSDFLGAVETSSNVRYGGVVEPGEVRSLIGRYDLLLLPTYHAGEGYPAVILEAFAAGVPVVATDWKSIPELVANGERGLIVPVRSPGKIREALDRLGKNDALYREMSCNAVSYVASFSERAVVRDILLERVGRLIGRSGTQA